MAEASLVLLLGAGATYVWRMLGVLLSGRLRTSGTLFDTLSCIAHALLAALLMRMIVLPNGGLAETPTAVRLGALGIALLAFYLSGKRLIVGVLAGAASLSAMLWLLPGFTAG